MYAYMFLKFIYICSNVDVTFLFDVYMFITLLYCCGMSYYCITLCPMFMVC